MSRDDGGAAFPREDYQLDTAPGQRGMSLRDYFAGQALGGIFANAVFLDAVRKALADQNRADDIHLRSVIAMQSYEMADAMLKARQT